jgi:hypothetical protein
VWKKQSIVANETGPKKTLLVWLQFINGNHKAIFAASCNLKYFPILEGCGVAYEPTANISYIYPVIPQDGQVSIEFQQRIHQDRLLKIYQCLFLAFRDRIPPSESNRESGGMRSLMGFHYLTTMNA